MEITSSAASLFQAGSSRRPSPQERFDQTDTDKSGALSLDEFKAGAQKDRMAAAMVLIRPNCSPPWTVTAMVS